MICNSMGRSPLASELLGSSSSTAAELLEIRVQCTRCCFVWTLVSKSLIPNISENWTFQRMVLRTLHKP
jgi:hypothetical protein